MTALTRFSAAAALAALSACTALPGGALGEAQTVYDNIYCHSAPAPAARWIDTQAVFESLMEEVTAGLTPRAAEDPVPVDFSRRGVLFLAMGQQPSAGYGLGLAGPEFVVENETAVVRVEWHEPAPGGFTAQIITRPCLMVSLPRGGYDRIRVVDLAGRQRAAVELPPR